MRMMLLCNLVAQAALSTNDKHLKFALPVLRILADRGLQVNPSQCYNNNRTRKKTQRLKKKMMRMI